MTSMLSVLISNVMQDLLHYLPITANQAWAHRKCCQVKCSQVNIETKQGLLLLLLRAWPTGVLWTQRAWPPGLLSLTWQQTSTQWKDWKRNVTAAPRPTGGRQHDPPRRVLMENAFTRAGPKVTVLLLLTIHLHTGEALLSFSSGMFHVLDGKEGNGSGVCVWVSEEPDCVELVRPATATCQKFSWGKFTVKVLRLMLNFYFSEQKYWNL